MEIGKPQVKTLPPRKQLRNIEQQTSELKIPFHLRVCFSRTQFKTLADLRWGPSSNPPCLHHRDGDYFI